MPILLFGFLSGLPLDLTTSTLRQWFASYGLSLHALGLTGLLGLPYTMKFLWSAVFDRPPPWGFGRFGRRRGWLLLVQPALACACVGLAFSDPGRSVWPTVLAVLLLAFFSASQDTLIDAWRIERFPARQQAAALAVYIWGYRAAMLTSGAGALKLSARFGWHVALLCVAGLLALGVLATLSAAEPAADAPPQAAGWRANVETAFVAPLREFLVRPGSLAILGFVLLFRIGKVLADTNADGFYRYRLHFSLDNVADANAAAIPAILVGAVFGGWLVARLGPMRAVLLAGGQLAAALGLYLVLLAFPSPAMLTVKVVLESFAQGTADACFLAYISTLCASAYTATQYALLSSLATVALHLFSGASGYLAEALGDRVFYAGTMLAGLPALAILWRVRRRQAIAA